MARYLLDQFDKNQDGKVSQKEIPLEPFRLKAFFMMADKNRDGEITLDELTSFLKDQQKRGKVQKAKPQK
jgi:Ca2+-binding EF-hand superfamily protein